MPNASRSSPRSRPFTREGVTIIWIEHVLHALNSVVERLLVLDFGKVIGIGAPDRRSWSPRKSGKSTWGSRYERF
jgi:energy-coupling factor transporter ATP-binding protein EcfA2